MTAWEAVVVTLCAVALTHTALILILYRQFGIVFLGQSDARDRDGLPVGSDAPAWTAVDQIGEQRRSEEFLGNPQLLVFTDPKCSPCRKLMPEINSYATDHRETTNIVVVGTDHLEENREMATYFGLDVPVFSQNRGDLSALFNVTATPFIFAIDRDGVIREKGVVNFKSQLEEKMKATRPGRTAWTEAAV